MKETFCKQDLVVMDETFFFLSVLKDNAFFESRMKFMMLSIRREIDDGRFGIRMAAERCKADTG